MSTMRIPTEFVAVDKFSAVVAKMASGVGNFTKATGSAVTRVNTKINGMFSSMDRLSQVALGAGVVGLFGMAGKAAMDYETALHSLEAVTGESASKYKKQIEELAKVNRKSVIDVASSFEVIGSAMSQYLDDPKALSQITQAGITLAKASRQELEPTLENLTSIMNQFDLGADKAYESINRLTAGEIVGQVHTSDVAQSLKQFGAVANASNVTLSESVALVQVLGKKLPTQELGTASRNLITLMSAAKGLPLKAREALAKHGVSLDKLSNKNLDLGVKLKELSKIQGDSAAMVHVFGKENMAAGTIILSNLKTYDKWEKQIETTNKANDQAATNSNTLAEKFKQLKDSFFNAVVTSDDVSTSMGIVGKALDFVAKNIDIVIAIAVGLGAFLLVIKGISTAMTVGQAVVAGYTAVMAAYEAVALTAAFTGASFAAVIWATLAPILAIIAVIALVVAAIYYWDDIVKWFGKQWDTFTKFLSEFDFVGLFIGIGQAIIEYMLFPLKSVLKLVAMIPGGIGKAAQSGLDKINEMTDLKMMIGSDVKKLDSPEQTNAKLMQENKASGGIDINVRDKGNNVESVNPFGNSGIPIKLSSTWGAF